MILCADHHCDIGLCGCDPDEQYRVAQSRAEAASPESLGVSQDEPQPSAWVLVPREPTEEIVRAGMVAPRSKATSATTNTYDRHASLSADIYRAMLSASPPPPAEPPVEGWRPIESAPRGFKPIIGWRPGGVRQWYRWVDDRHSGTGWYNSEQGRVADPPPTLWHAIPSPPGEAASPARGPSHRLADDKAKPSTSLGGDSRASVADSGGTASPKSDSQHILGKEDGRR